MNIQNDFIKYKQQLMQNMGTVLPAGIKNPDDYVADQAQQMAMQGLDPMSGAPMDAPSSIPFPNQTG